jgi:hypothetical protein
MNRTITEMYKNALSFSMNAVSARTIVDTTNIKNPISAAFFLPNLSSSDPAIGEKIRADTSKDLKI